MAFLIDKAEQDKRLKTMQQVCLSCTVSPGWPGISSAWITPFKPRTR